MTHSSFGVDERGYYGEFGGAFIPEMLRAPLDELQQCYRAIIDSEPFQREFQLLLRDYVGRPTPLYEATRLSAHYNARVLLKREDLNHTGAHKINNTLGQVLLAQHLGKKRIIAETGAGQHGVATATACALLGLECVVYMGELDMQRQQPNVERMNLLGATVVPVLSGSRTLKDATNEAMRDWLTQPDTTHYSIGSVVGPHPYPDMVARFQSVISREVQAQLHEQYGLAAPHCVVACVGGGSNAIGAFYHFIDNPNVRLVGVEAAGKGIYSGFSAATLARGSAGVLHGCATVLLQTDDGQVVEPYSLSAGLDYPGIGPAHAWLHATERVQYTHCTDDEALAAALQLCHMEGIIPALESAHALACLEHLALHRDDSVIVCLSGRGDKDVQAYCTYTREKGGAE